MKTTYLLLAIVVIFCMQSFAQQTNEKKYHKWWDERNPGQPMKFDKAKKMPLIKVVGNHFEDPSGKTVLFRGVSISDPDKIENQGNWNKQVFTNLKSIGVKVVRIPVHPVAWRDRGYDGYLKLLDQAVEWATDEGIYIMIDWHSIGNLKSGLYQDPMYITSLTETFTFWRTIANRYQGINTIAFYELFNEPTLYNNQLGCMTWDEWKAINEEMIAIIRAFDKEKIPMVAGFDWAYELKSVLKSPINAEGICYVSHPYPHKRSKPYEEKWEADFGHVASKYPVVATEIGYTMPDMAVNEDYGRAIVKYLEGRGMSWVAWVIDAEWGPNMIDSWKSFKITDYGKYFVEVMKANK
jgi:endoglucanase